MLRLPPTSINLSQEDLNSHLQQIDIYHGLLKQGFKKKEIIRYFEDQRAAQEANSPNPSFVDDDPDSSILASSLHAQSFSDDIRHDTSEAVENTKTAELGKTVQNDFLNVVSSPTENEHVSAQSSVRSTRSTSMTLPADEEFFQDMKTRNMSQDHAPRRSSLLRFARNISSDLAENEQKSSNNFSPRPNVTYRPRSQTYSYDQSEVDEEPVNSHQDNHLSQDLEHLTLSDELLPMRQGLKVISPSSSNLSPEAPVFLPLRLPPPFSATPRVSPTNSVDLSSFQAMRLTDAFSTYSSMAGLSPDVSVSGDNASTTEHPIVSFDSSPPVLHEEGGGLMNPASPTLLLQPLTPPGHGSTQARTQPRPNRARFLDGSFTVYDDSLPSNTQPQTPADLARRNQFNERNVAYTAPPGMVPSSSARRDQVTQNLRLASGEPSPTFRAVTVRQRRQREFARGARVEGLRIERLRQQTSPDQRHRVTDFGRQLELEMWRDDLDADRVGEENFDEEGLTEAFGTGMRLVSGNRRVI